ncbi:MAG: YceI family protein [Ferruginibacter sp.]
MKQCIITYLLLLNVSLSNAQVTLQPQEAYSKISFKIKNFGMNTDGRLTGIKGNIVFDNKQLSTSYFDVTVNTANIDTDNSRRDKHLKGADYFDALKFPSIKITGKPALSQSGTYVLAASLTIKGITKQIQIAFKAIAQNGGWLFTATFEIDRLDFKVGEESMVLSNKVKVMLSIVAK